MSGGVGYNVFMTIIERTRLAFRYLAGITSEWQKEWENQTAEMMEAVNNRHAGQGTYTSGFRSKEVERLLTKREREFEEEKRRRAVAALVQWVPIIIAFVALGVSTVISLVSLVLSMIALSRAG